MSSTPVAACTISSNNYLALTKVLAESYQEHHPGAPVYVCIVDRPDPSLDYTRMPFIPIFAEELDIPSFFHFAYRYDILELNTAVKPYVLTYLRDHYQLDRIFYFDPDILIHDRLTKLEEALDQHQAVLTPHITEPLDNVQRPPERFIRACGVYNLGFLGIRFDEQTAAFLEWWTDRLNRYCFSDLPNGIFVDQSWMGFAPAYLESVAVVRDPIFNIAYWNLPHRYPEHREGYWQVGGERVGFFHFSGLDLGKLDQISKHQDRIDLERRPELRPLLEEYRDRVLDAGHDQLRSLSYHYSCFFDNGVPIPRTSRVALRTIDPQASRWPNPFIAAGDDSFYSWLCEPVALELGTLTRTAIFYWEARTDLIAHMPDALGQDLPAYVEWLRQGGAAEANLHPCFLANLSTKPGVGGVKKGAWQIPPHYTLSFDQQVAALDTIDLANPGPMTAWLNQPMTSNRPVLTRLALLLYQVTPHLQHGYPDPFGLDQTGFAYWMALIGAEEYNLHPDLVAPMLRSLPLKSRLGITLRRWKEDRRTSGATAAGGEAPVMDEPRHAPVLDERYAAHGQSGAPPVASAPPPPAAAATGSPARRGVNLVRRETAPAAPCRLFSAMSLAISGCELDCAEAAVTLGIPVRLTREKLCDQAGTPHAVTLVHADPQTTIHLLQALPPVIRLQGYRIAYWRWDLAFAPLSLAPACDLIDEIWVPTRFAQQTLETMAGVPVRLVPPCVPPPEVTPAERKPLGLDQDRFYFFACVDVADHPERLNPAAAITAIEHLVEQHLSRPVGLLLQLQNAAHDRAYVCQLQRQAQGLPVVIGKEAVSYQKLLDRLVACDAYLSLHRCEGLGQLAIESLLLDRPVVATDYGGPTDFLDNETGYPVAHKLTRIKQGYESYPAGAVWAEADTAAATAALRLVVEERSEAARRTAAGRDRVQQRYGIQAATSRFATELNRVHDQTEARTARSRSTVDC